MSYFGVTGKKSDVEGAEGAGCLCPDTYVCCIPKEEMGHRSKIEDGVCMNPGYIN